LYRTKGKRAPWAQETERGRGTGIEMRQPTVVISHQFSVHREKHTNTDRKQWNVDCEQNNEALIVG
ncbi:MAG TPA: hypothetical protein PK125_13635, partial [Syntrophorhabdus sp.]|nr:hypothetical protein [Syntrophorhabdus sp.]